MIRYGVRLGALVMVGVLGLGAREDDGGLPDDLARVPASSQAVLSVRVADLWNSELGKDARKALGKEENHVVAEFKRTFLVPPDQVERLTVCGPELVENRAVVYLTRVTTKLDAKKALPKLIPEGREEKIGTQAVYIGRDRAAFLSDDGKTVVIGTPLGVRNLLEAKPGKPSAGLALMLSKAAKHSISGYVDPSPLAKMIDKLPPPLAPAKPLILATDGVAWLDVGYTSKLGMKITFKDEKEAGRGRKAIDAARALGSLALSGLSERIAAESKPLAALMSKVEKALDDGSVAQKGSAVDAALELTVEKATVAGLLKEMAGKALVASARAQSVNNLKQIGLALHNYHSRHDVFPPQAVYDKDGKALLSWRVAILPYLSQDELYKQFNLDEPWDSPHNKKLIAKIPRSYVSPHGKASAVGGTFYQAFLGKSAAFEGKRGLKITNFFDGTSNTILVAEAAADVPWTKPDDLPFDPDGKLPKLGGLFENGFNTLFADGSVRFISNSIKVDTLKALITRNGGEPLGSDF
jgi:prepilin-type processing-associated H-X9-DG protein